MDIYKKYGKWQKIHRPHINNKGSRKIQYDMACLSREKMRDVNMVQKIIHTENISGRDQWNRNRIFFNRFVINKKVNDGL
jgi:D-alanyl-D-alanine carboxypeptidase